MLPTLLLFSAPLILAFILLLIVMLTKPQLPLNRNKMSPFECGFDPMNKARTPFSTRYFLLTVIFLIFDVEIALMLPFPITMLTSQPMSYIIPLSLFTIIVTLGLLHEWNEGSLQWSP